MPIKKDLSSMSAPGEFPPDRTLRVLGPVFDAWYEDWLADNHLGHAIEGTRFRASNAGKCTRMLGYADAGLPKDRVPSGADAWRMGLGTIVHDIAQTYATKVWASGVEVEVKAMLVDIDGSCHVDMVVTGPISELAPHMIGHPYTADDTWTISVELKSASGYPFKLGTTNFKGPAEGPKLGHIFQACLCGEAVDADEVIVGWIALENLGKTWNGLNPDLGERDRFLAEWSYTRAEYRKIAQVERNRLTWLHRRLDASAVKLAKVDAKLGVDGPSTSVGVAMRAARTVPRMVLLDDMTPAEIVNPNDGSAEVHGEGNTILKRTKHWECNYCDYQPTCVADYTAEL